MTCSPGPAIPSTGLVEVPGEHLSPPEATDRGRLEGLTSPTEARNTRTIDIDLVPTSVLLRILNREDGQVAGAVRATLATLARVVDEAAARIARGGRVHYFGAGSSGRIAVIDAAELAPTFGLEPGVVVAHLAGGEEIMTRASEGLEDDRVRGASEAADVEADDLVIGLSASGHTPYVAGALARAAEAGAFGVLVTCNPLSPLRSLVAACLIADTGPEAITGSTRMKAATAEKLILNSFSTALMVKLGKTYSNLMVDVSVTNAKLRARLVRIVAEATGAGQSACIAALAEAQGDVKTAIVELLAEVGTDEARLTLAASGQSVQRALARLGADGRGRRDVRGRTTAAEMAEQPAVLRGLLGRADEIARIARACARDCAGIVIVGHGTSGHAGLYGRYLLQMAWRRPVGLVSPDEQALCHSGTDYEGYLAIAIGQSARERDTVAALDQLRRAGARGIAITNGSDRPLAEAAEHVIDIGAGVEHALPGTKIFTAELMAIALLARGLAPDAVGLGALSALPDHVQAALEADGADAAGATVAAAPAVVSLAGGYLYAVARQAALEIAGAASVLAAAYSIGELRHGLLAGVRPGLAVLCLGEDSPADLGLGALRSHLATRAADVIEVSPAPGAHLSLPRGLPGWALPIVAAVRCQQVALAAALWAGRDPDQPGDPERAPQLDPPPELERPLDPERAPQLEQLDRRG